MFTRHIIYVQQRSKSAGVYVQSGQGLSCPLADLLCSVKYEVCTVPDLMIWPHWCALALHCSQMPSWHLSFNDLHLGKIISRQHFEIIFFFIFPRELISVFWKKKKKKKKVKLLSAELTQRVVWLEDILLTLKALSKICNEQHSDCFFYYCFPSKISLDISFESSAKDSHEISRFIFNLYKSSAVVTVVVSALRVICIYQYEMILIIKDISFYFYDYLG